MGDVRGETARRPPPPVASTPAGTTPTSLDRAENAAPIAFVESVDGAYLRWSVVEVDAGGVPGAHGVRCLLFRRDDCIRRVWDYPADWRTLDAAALAALSWHR
jgi:hypothetical protein